MKTIDMTPQEMERHIMRFNDLVPNKDKLAAKKNQLPGRVVSTKKNAEVVEAKPEK